MNASWMSNELARTQPDWLGRWLKIVEDGGVIIFYTYQGDDPSGCAVVPNVQDIRAIEASLRNGRDIIKTRSNTK